MTKEGHIYWRFSGKYEIHVTFTNKCSFRQFENSITFISNHYKTIWHTENVD
jgi:hypothetical protein